MTVTLELKPEVEERIVAEAKARGLSVEDYILNVLEKEATNGEASFALTATPEECLFPLLWSCGQSETRFAIRRLFFQDIENIVLNRQTARFGFSDDSLFNFRLEFEGDGHGSTILTLLHGFVFSFVELL